MRQNSGEIPSAGVKDYLDALYVKRKRDTLQILTLGHSHD